MESVTVITEPLLHEDFVQFEIVGRILERLTQQYDITLAAPRIAPRVQRKLEELGIHSADGGATFLPIRRSRDEIPAFVGSWLRDSIWGWNRRAIERVLKGKGGVRINVSMTTAIDADIWLIQSRPLGLALEVMRHSVSRPMRMGLAVGNPFVGRLDHRHVLEAGRRARLLYTTTQHVADWFEAQGLPIEGVLPMYYRPTIRRTVQNPTRDFILVYVGKETDSAALRGLLDTGLPVTMFGSKSLGWVKAALKLDKYPHARLLGYVTDDELSNLYSNARFTAFPFTEEPFGLVPLESMACGTPVLTYGVQGPGETVLDGQTGWLVGSRQAFVSRAVELWNSDVPSAWMVERCLHRAKSYHLDAIGTGWGSLIRVALDQSGKAVSRPTPSTHLRPGSWAGIDRAGVSGAFPVPPGILPRQRRPVLDGSMHLGEVVSPRESAFATRPVEPSISAGYPGPATQPIPLDAPRPEDPVESDDDITGEPTTLGEVPATGVSSAKVGIGTPASVQE